jgi:flagellar hook-associated protein 2
MTLPLFNIGGLMSGLDTNSIIDGLLSVERIPINQLEARKAGYTAKDNAWQDVNTRFSAIRTALSAIDSQADFNKLVTATSSQESAVVATPAGSATPGTLSFVVDQLATTHQVATATSFTGGSDLVGAGDFTITIGGTDHVITSDTSTTLDGVAQQINALDAGVHANVLTVDATSSKLVIAADDSGASNAFTTSSTIASLASTTIVEQGDDAQLTIGSGPGALTLSRSSNTVTDLVSGVTLELKDTSASPVTITVARDTDATVEAITTLVTEINSTLSKLGELTAYNAESDSGGALVGDSTARALLIDLRSAISGTVNDAAADYAIASQIGISLNRQGTFDLDATELREALEADHDQVMDLLLQSGSAFDGRLSFVSAGANTVEGDYEVVVSQAAERASALSNKFKKPNSDVTFQIIVGTTTVDVSVVRNDPVTTVVQAINDALDAAGVNSVTASEVAQGNDDYIQLDHAQYGAAASFEVVGDPFGLAGVYSGLDVVGTIGGQVATGSGRTLTSTAGDPDGLVVTVGATQAEVGAAGGSLSLGDVSYERGIFGSLDTMLDAVEGSGGRIARARDAWQAQIDIVDDRIEVLEDRLDRREALLLKQFSALESAMATLSSQAAWLSSQISSLNAGGTSS